MSPESRSHSQRDSEREVQEAGDPRAPRDAQLRESAATGSLIQGDARGESSGHPDDQRAEIEALRRELAVTEENARVQRELYLRAAAEIDNVRKRAQRDIEQAHRYAIESFAAELLAVRDSLELGVRNAANADAQTLLQGQEATLKLLDRAFERFSIRQIDPAGQRFDPNQHEAVLMQEAGDAPANSVLQVVQSGYELNGRLLRPARVIVAKANGASGS